MEWVGHISIDEEVDGSFRITDSTGRVFADGLSTRKEADAALCDLLGHPRRS